MGYCHLLQQISTARYEVLLQHQLTDNTQILQYSRKYLSLQKKKKIKTSVTEAAST